MTKTKMVTTNNNQLLILFLELQLNYMYDPTLIKNNITICIQLILKMISRARVRFGSHFQRRISTGPLWSNSKKTFNRHLTVFDLFGISLWVL